VSTETHDRLNKAITDHFLDLYGDDESSLAIITHWTIVAAGVDSDGNPHIMNEYSDEKMPFWMTRGLLHEGIYQSKITESDE
jgi:hypothetical protein